MGKTAAELGLSGQELFEDIPDMETLPEEYSPRTPPPYPGDYLFETPKDFSHLWDKFEGSVKDPKNPDAEAPKREFVNLIFDKENPLMIKKALTPDGEKWEGTSLQYRLNNRPRARGKEKTLISDMSYFAKALGATGAAPRTNGDQIKQVNQLAGRSFVAFAEYTGSCNPKRQAYVLDDSNNIVPSKSETGEVKGCGARIFFNDWPKVDGRYADKARCPKCQAIISPFTGLVRFRKTQG